MSKKLIILGKWKKLEDIYSSLLDIIEDTETSDIAPLENRICAVSASDRLTFYALFYCFHIFHCSKNTNQSTSKNNVLQRVCLFVSVSVFQVVFLIQHIVYNFKSLYSFIRILFAKVVEFVFGYLYDILIILGQHGAKFMKT